MASPVPSGTLTLATGVDHGDVDHSRAMRGNSRDTSSVTALRGPLGMEMCQIGRLHKGTPRGTQVRETYSVLDFPASSLRALARTGDGLDTPTAERRDLSSEEQVGEHQDTVRDVDGSVTVDIKNEPIVRVSLASIPAR